MTAMACRFAAVLAVVWAILILTSCSGETGPQPGTPAFHWGAAKQTFTAGDYAKTLDNLDKIVATDNDFKLKAQPWLLVLSSGMARGYVDMANACENGGRANRRDAAAFRRNMNQYRGDANRLSLHFAETFANFQKNKDEYVTLAFGYPPGMPTPVLALDKIHNGTLPQPAELESTQNHVIGRRVLLTTCAAAGAPDDPAKTQDIMKSQEAKVPRAAFVMAMAIALYDQSQLYSRQKMDDPEKLKIFCTRAQEALKSIPESKQTKDLNDKIQKALKANKA
jgi:hypothetical protein